MDSLYIKYAEIEAALEKLETQKLAMRSEILEKLIAEGKAKDVSPVGTFTVGRKKLWKYSDSVAKLEEKAKIAKLKEQKSGKATSSESTYLIFNEATVV